MKYLTFVPMLVGAASLCGCATVFSGTTQSVKVDSTPQGATVFAAEKVNRDGTVVYENRREVGQTPISAVIARKDGVIILEKPGYETTEVPLQRSMAGWVWGDIIATSPLSTSVDTSTGAAKVYDPDEYLVEMKTADSRK